MKQKALESAAGLVVAAYLRSATWPDSPILRSALERSYRYHDDPGGTLSDAEVRDATPLVIDRIERLVDRLIEEHDLEPDADEEIHP